MTQPDNPKAQEAQRAMLKLLGQPPEQLLHLLDRLQIPWERRNLGEESESCLVIKWADFMAGEERNQAEGPFIRKLVMELKNEYGEELSQMDFKPTPEPKKAPAKKAAKKATPKVTKQIDLGDDPDGDASVDPRDT